jgi:hypothetical protein
MILLTILMVCFFSVVVSVKSINHLIKNVDPLAQQIMVLDRTHSSEITQIKGELMRDLIRNYYNKKDSTKKKL